MLKAIEDAFSVQLGPNFPVQRLPQLFGLLDTLLTTQPDATRDMVRTFIAAEEPRFLAYLRLYPERVLFFADQEVALRRLWFTHLFADGRPDMTLYTALLRNGLVREADLTEAHVRAVRRIRGDVPSPDQARLLEQSGFFKAFEEHAFVEGMIDKFAWGNPNANLIQWYIESRPISDECVQSVCKWFTGKPYAVQVRNALESLFSTNSEKRREFQTVAARLGCPLPAEIPALNAPLA